MSRFLSRLFLSKPLSKSNSARKREERLTRLALEPLEKRDLPSATSMPSPEPQGAADTSFVATTMNQCAQLLATVEQDISNALHMLGQEIALDMSFVQHLLDPELGTPSSSPPAPAAPQPSSAAGVGQGNASGAPTTGQESATGIANITAKPMTAGGGTSGTTGGGTSGTTGGGTSGTTGGGTSGTTGGGLPGAGGSGGGVYVSGMPAGLRDVSQLAPSYLTESSPYAETHAINRSESNTVTITQSGGGTSGTWAVTVTGSTNSSDNANGSGGGTSSTSQSSENSSGTANAASDYKLVMSGIYSNGTFSVTSETYNATGSSSSSQTSSQTTGSSLGESYSDQNSNSSDNYTESWSAGLNGSGQLVFDSYSLTETTKVYFHSDSGGNGISGGTTSTAETSMTASGQGTTATYSANETLDQTFDDNGSTSTQNQSNPVSGTVYIGGLPAQPSGWKWFAGTSDATNYTFNGSASENATLAETATWQTGGSGSSLVVNSFNSYYKGAASGQVQDDEPETPASPGGTDSFYRNETYGISDTVTGSGSYGGGNTNATFQAVRVGNFNVSDTEYDNNETQTGTDSSGNTYTTNYNYGGQINGSGSFTETDNYQDVGQGLTVTSETLGASATGTDSFQFSGTSNGQAFDDSSTEPETWSDPQETIPGGGPVTNPDGLVNAFPFQDTVTPNGADYGAASNGGFLLAVNAARPIAPPVQELYNYLVERAGEGAKKKVAELGTKRQVMDQIRLTKNATGTLTLEGPNVNVNGQIVAGPRGNIVAAALGVADELADKQKKQLATFEAVGQRNGFSNIQLGRTDAVVTYAVDGAILPPGQLRRSGNVAVKYSIEQTYTRTNPTTGQTITSRIVTLVKTAVFHDDELESMENLTVPAK